MPPISPVMTVMIGAARKAARVLQRDFNEVWALQVSKKGPSDFVSAADRKTEQVLIGELQKARPGYGIMAEESGVVEGPDKTHRWYIDPLDGTTNFLHAVPHFAISIGLEREGQLVAGLVYNPISNELFHAEKGQGAFLNDKRLRVSARTDMGEALTATGIPYRGRDGHKRFLAELESVMAQTAGVRRFGSAALDLAFVAAGRYDLFWERGLAAWDVAAGIVLVREAGGVVTDLNGGAILPGAGSILAGNEPLHGPFLSLIKAA